MAYSTKVAHLYKRYRAGDPRLRDLVRTFRQDNLEGRIVPSGVKINQDSLSDMIKANPLDDESQNIKTYVLVHVMRINNKSYAMALARVRRMPGGPIPGDPRIKRTGYPDRLILEKYTDPRLESDSNRLIDMIDRFANDRRYKHAATKVGWSIR